MGKRFIEIIRYFFKCLSQVIYPSLNKCLCCREAVGEEQALCASCEKGIRQVQGAYKLGNINSYSVAYYSQSMKRLIINFKYGGDFYCGEYLARLLKKKFIEEKLHADLITFVPSSKKALKKRGFNQCEVLAKALSRELNIPYLNTLDRIKDGKEQKRLSREERILNMQEAFKIRNNISIKGKKIILIDDVITTGATLLSCANQLKKNEDAEIIILTVSKSYI